MDWPLLPEHLNSSDALLATVSALRSALVLIAPGRRPAYANPALLDLTGYTYDEFMALERTSAISARHDERATSETLNRALRGEATPFRLRPVVRKDGSEIWVEGAVTPIVLQGDRYLLAEFRPTCEAPPDGAEAWRPR